ncbi:MAG TPA: carboxypeptidase-like regulatory domain-containing protein [Candidatus Acidoferrales bacterium]|nr:carboxypeptidase-like regulatory domain-containing protein [Candidatus Acidoferrales bacterium]
MLVSSKNSIRVSAVFFVALLAVLFGLFTIAPQAALAQSANSGTVSGTVVDPSNAIVPGASITLVNTATLATRTTLSNKEGQYVFAFVDPGTYKVSVSKAGFKTTVVSNQVVQLGLQTTINITLQVGEATTTVEVTSIPGANLQTLTPTVGTTLSSAIILNLPNQNRDASTLATLEPGQNINGATGGMETDQNSFQLDGGFATDDMSGDNNTYISSFSSDTSGVGATHSPGINAAPSAVVPVPVASIQEFKVSTANQTADFNGGAGSQVELVTKPGTDTFHGSAYDYYLDSTFGGANSWDNNARGKKPNGEPVSPLLSSHFSRFGAAAGGKIPHANFLGGGWYIFGNYEGFRFPQASTFERSFPLPSLEAGLIHLAGQTINLNPFPVVDPGCGSTVTSGCNITTAGQTIQPTACGAGNCDPRNLGTTTNGVAGGPVNPVIALWQTYLPAPNDCSQGDGGLNFCGYVGSIATPQKSNFFVTRIDHEFAKNWHFTATYHYYDLSNTVADQWDIGGFFPGDKPGQYAAIRQKPQVPWIYTAGLTTTITSNLTNAFHFSYTRNWWAYGDPSGVPNTAGFPANLEVGGENSGAATATAPLFGPYNTNNQSTRTRYWNGHDWMYRDDLTWVKGNHLFQFGGMYLRANDTHNRNDNGQSINTFEQYLIGEGITTDLSGFMNFGAYTPSGITGNNALEYDDLYSMVLGIVNQSQSLYTRGLGSTLSGLPLLPRTPGNCAIKGIAATADCTNSPPLTNTSIIPTYNAYFTDSWHLRPTFSLNYGIGYTVEMPPYETRGGEQSVMVDQNNHILYVQQYLKNVEQAALQGNAYAPLIGFAAVRNVQDHSHYPYDPYFLGFSPRIGFAWNFRPDTVVRAGYSRIFGRINGVDPVLVPMLTPALMQPATCTGPTNVGTCGSAAALTTPLDAFRVGVDGVNAPLPQPSAFLPQPWYPGSNDVSVGSSETFDPNFHPNRSDEFTLSIQHQFTPKILAEAGYIGRNIANEMVYYSLTNVPYMMTEGGQTFANAWAEIMTATNYGTQNLVPCGGGVTTGCFNTQPFFEAALGGPSSAYCSTFASCTAAFVSNSDAQMKTSNPFVAWQKVSNKGAFIFGRSFTSDPIGATATGCTTPTPGLGCNGQSPSIITQASDGFGNYNAGYLQLTFSDYHGLTMKTNFSYSNALGVGNVVQASSSVSTVDPYNLQNAYGPQSYNEKFVFNLFMSYAPPFYRSQNGPIGHLLGGWTFAPLFVWGSGFPVSLLDRTRCGTFGECNRAQGIGSQENAIITQDIHYSAQRNVNTATTGCGTAGRGQNVFSNPNLSCPTGGGIFGDPVRDPILGLDGQIGGGGPLYGLPFWNMDLGITKDIKIKERLSSSLYFDFTNVLNHMQPADPSFNLANLRTWGTLGGGGNVQSNQPRRLQLGISIDW